MIQALILSIVLAAGPTAEKPVASSTSDLSSLPDEAIVLELRRARIAGQQGNRDRQRALLDALVAGHPEDPTALAAALAFHREVDGESEATRALRLRLLDALAQPGRLVPLPLLQDVVRDKNTSDDLLARLLNVLATQAGTGSDRVAGLRLRVALLDRLRRDTDALVALNELATLDPDPLVAFRLLQRYRELGRWDDVLRVTAAIDPGQASFEMGWFRLEALGALGRPDELLSEADTLIGRLRARSTPHTDLVSRVTPTIAPSASPASTFESMPPYLAERFFPIVFVLLDSGRREPAERLVAALATASPDADNVKRLHVMLFGSPDDRIAFLQATAGASVASNDPEKIRTDAYQRLLAKDFGTAHDLYRRLLELDPAASSFDSGDWFNYGLAAIETAAWAEAETAMTHALESGASKPRAYAHRARARIMLGRIAEGMADAEAALAIDPKLKQACFAMYLAYEKLGVHEKAKEWLARSNAP